MPRVHITIHHVTRDPIGRALFSFLIGELLFNVRWMLCYFSKGGDLPHVLPEYLMSYNDYKTWLEYNKDGEKIGLPIYEKANLSNKLVKPICFKLSKTTGLLTRLPSCLSCPSEQEFERLSEIAWTDIFIQLLKASGYSFVTKHIYCEKSEYFNFWENKGFLHCRHPLIWN